VAEGAHHGLHQVKRWYRVESRFVLHNDLQLQEDWILYWTEIVFTNLAFAIRCSRAELMFC
jgi:hypothetical protein